MPRYVPGLCLALVFCIALVVFAPARLLGLLLPADKIVLQGFEGTVWSGSASRSLIHASTGYLHLGRLQWSLEPLSLVLLAPRLTVHSNWGGQLISGEVVVRGQSSLDLHQVEAQVAAQLLRQFLPVVLTGSLSAQLESLLLREGLPYSGAGRLVWQRGGWQSPQGQQQLGSYALDFQQSAGDALLGEVLTLAGPVEARGTVRLEGRSYEIDILVGSQAGLDPQLEQALSLIAAPGPEGYRVRLEGDL